MEKVPLDVCEGSKYASQKIARQINIAHLHLPAQSQNVKCWHWATDWVLHTQHFSFKESVRVPAIYNCHIKALFLYKLDKN